jgi:hypothetical protein
METAHTNNEIRSLIGIILIPVDIKFENKPALKCVDARCVKYTEVFLKAFADFYENKLSYYMSIQHRLYTTTTYFIEILS